MQRWGEASRVEYGDTIDCISIGDLPVLEGITFRQSSHLLIPGVEAARTREPANLICVERTAVNCVKEFCMACL